MEMLATFFIVPALVFAYFGLVFGLGQFLSPERVRQAIRSLWPLQVNLWHLMTVVAVAAFVILLLESHAAVNFTLFAISFLILAWFARSWSHEFVFLMGLQDDYLPGRHDKLVWLLLLSAFAPIGVWLFRSYRMAHWPEPATESSRALGPENAGTAAAHAAGM
jgi:hypothetical protein